MDCLDEPLHLNILTSLAANIARCEPRKPQANGSAGAESYSTENGSTDVSNDASIVFNGLPGLSTKDSSTEEDDEDDEWSEFETNHAISFAHYVGSLAPDSPHLLTSLPKLKALLAAIIRQGSPLGPSSLSSPSSSSGPSTTARFQGTAQQNHLCREIMNALLRISWSSSEAKAEIEKELVDLFAKVAEMMTGSRSLTLPLTLLEALHQVFETSSAPPLSTSSLANVLRNLLAVASPSNLVKLLHHCSSRPSPGFVTPAYSSRGSEAVRVSTPAGVVIAVSEIANTLLAGSLLSANPPNQHDLTSNGDDSNSDLNTYDDDMSPTYSRMLSALISKPIREADLTSNRLYRSSTGSYVADDLDRAALRWWTEATASLNTDDDDEANGYGRRESLFHFASSSVNSSDIAEEDTRLPIAVLHLMNLVNLHRDDPESGHIARLKLLLSENSPITDPHVLDAAFDCTSVMVRNNQSLATDFTLHIRRLLLTPLPAFEAEIASCGGDTPSVVKTASQCLAICIVMSGDDDLISSTLYSLLNTLSHGGSVLISGAASVLRSHPPHLRDTDSGTMASSFSSGKKTDDQRSLVAVTAIQVVSRLSLEMDREDIIHLSISLLLQRLRGVDPIVEATICANLVPLALAGSKSDLVEVYRAFSQISRSSSNENPRLSSNAILAAQTQLARGLGSRLDCAEGYLFDLLTLFADKGTQTQMIAMAPSGYETRDQEKLGQLHKDSETRVTDMRAWLAALLIPISTLLSHDSFTPATGASTDLVGLFRSLWFICVAFELSGSHSKDRLSEHETIALGMIAYKSPALIVENATDYVDSDLEYNSILRKDFAHSIASRNRTQLQEYLSNQRSTYDIRNMSPPRTTLLLAIAHLEQARTERYRPSVMLQYFCNESVNSSSLISSVEAIAQKISNIFLKQLSQKVVTHSLPTIVSDEVCKILVACTHRFRKVREVARSYAKQLLETFSALLCDRSVVFTLLEVLTLMRRSCELQYTDEYSPIYDFHSDKMDLTLHLTDDYVVRNEITTHLYGLANHWLALAISRAPLEVQSTLQSYLNESRDVLLVDSVEMGAGLALHFSKAISKMDRQETIMPTIGGWPSDSSNLVASQFAAKNYFSGELSGARHVLTQGLANLQQSSPEDSSRAELLAFKTQMADAVSKIRKHEHFSIPDIRRLLQRGSAVLRHSPTIDKDILHYLVELPMAAFTPLAIAAGVDAWTWLLRERPDAEITMLGEISAGWLESIRLEKGLFSTSMNYKDPFEYPVEYSPSDKKIVDLELAKARRMLKPHLLLIQILSSQFQAVKYREPGIMISLIRLMMRSLGAAKKMSTHPLAREVRFSFLLFGFQILASSRMEALLELRFRDRLYATAYAWFSVRPQWSFGSDRIQVGAEIKLLQEFAAAIAEDHVRGDHSTSSMADRSPAFLIRGSTSLHDYTIQHRDRVRILQLLVESEINRLHVWCNPANEAGRAPAAAQNMEKSVAAEEWTRLMGRAWTLSPSMAVHMAERFKHPAVLNEITRLIRANPKAVVDVPEALHFLLGEKLEPSNRDLLKWLPFWGAVPPVTALAYFQPRYGNHSLILQYAMRVLEQFPVELTFFFVPQVVQGLRIDGLGYVERFIFETSKVSQLFCHQIIWNMKANMFKDDDGSVPDAMKPMLDRMIDMIVAGLSPKAFAFYNLEFSFFDAVTSISGKLKPFIKASKPEKKAKIDEEMMKIKLEVGVYLPSNPDGVVIDLDRKSGRPLQSHAKAPFMATFKVQKERLDLPSDASVEISEKAAMVKSKYDVWQAAMFKVGDDCRQDVLALQIIAMFKNIFTQLGLALYLFPYRVTATAPGCGVIDVVPNATSRDEMGRAKINDLLAYFVDKYGGVDTVSFQKARMNFIQSMAAYSVACYILQIKDRHNGNIMIDADGHIVHIDFGFLFDIGPGGMKFEPNSFKLNHEMVALMGGRDSQGYKMFAELTIKAFLAIRPHADQLCDACHLMLGTDLPSFKGEGTIKRLRDRFQLHLGEKAAAEYMAGVIRNAHENVRSNVYDGFQKLQNGIPY